VVKPDKYFPREWTWIFSTKKKQKQVHQLYKKFYRMVAYDIDFILYKQTYINLLQIIGFELILFH